MISEKWTGNWVSLDKKNASCLYIYIPIGGNVIELLWEVGYSNDFLGTKKNC